MSASRQSHDWLLLFLRVLDLVARPSPANILQPFEAWEHRSRLRLRLRSLERAQYLERVEGRSVRRPTAAGRATAWGGLDPAERWKRLWDGQWRIVIFDLPAREVSLRQQLARWLHAQRLGYLQNSVWISPDPIDSQPSPVRRLKPNSEAFTVLTSRPVPPSTDASLVEGAWDFAHINQRYGAWFEVADRGLELTEASDLASAKLKQWLRAEREAWLAAATMDPFLPEQLLPAGYAGRKAWDRRNAVFAALARHVVGVGS